ncbi:MAG: TIGR03663 family protein [Verrucomicrobia subdivision 3 bacterium]|nr:TIGR03663 family protein [Verrucomicrobiota bacterium]MCC6819157.1 TIGR03663 family protein [Limisphaerales bacterium]
MNRWTALALLLAVAGALALRVPQLAVRPLHNDEAINATKLAALWEKGEYRYDPDEYHGPTLYYCSLPFLALSSLVNSDAPTGSQLPAAQGGGRPTFSDSELRLVIVAFGVGLILLLLLLTDGLGPGATGWAAIFLAVSPAMVFYSRYFIHEMLLIFFTLLTLAAGWRYAQSHQAGWAAVTGAGVGLMFATKETFVLSLAAMTLALVATWSWNRWRARRLGGVPALVSGSAWMPSSRHAGLALAVAGGVGLVFFSSFFTNASGLLDSVKTYLPWLHRAGGASPHIHPWNFYLERLVWFHPPKSPIWSEALILLLAAVGGGVAFSNNPDLRAQPTFARFLTFYTLALTAIYTLIAYKTPWCLLNFWLGMILLAGIGAAALFRLCRSTLTKLLLVAALAVGVGHLGNQAWRAAVTQAANPRNPYVYAQTTDGCRQLVARVEAVARVASGPETVVKVIAPESYWPLPWYLRSFKHLGWWDKLPADPYAPIVLVSAKLDALLDEKSNKAWIMTGYYELRPGVYFELYVERGLWEKFVATLPRTDD